MMETTSLYGNNGDDIIIEERFGDDRIVGGGGTDRIDAARASTASTPIAATG